MLQAIASAFSVYKHYRKGGSGSVVYSGSPTQSGITSVNEVELDEGYVVIAYWVVVVALFVVRKLQKQGQVLQYWDNSGM